MYGETERYGELFKAIQSTIDEQRNMYTEVEDKSAERYGDMFTEVEDKSTGRYGDLFKEFCKAKTQTYEELSTQMKRSTDTNISIEDCIAYLNAAKARIDELEKVGTYQATQESKSIKSDFSELVEKMLKDKFFAIGDVNGKFAAFVFDSSAKRDNFVMANPQSNLAKAGFSEFVKQAQIGHRNISNYYSCDGMCLIYQI